MKLTFAGAAHEVTGSCYHLYVGDTHLLVDCGMEQGPDLYENKKPDLQASDVDFVLLTHAHIDHSGYVPLLYKRGFRGKVFATSATVDLCEIMLRDSAYIQESEAEWRNRKARRSGNEPYEPIYTIEDAQNALELFVPCRYAQVIEINENIKIRFTDVGHLLGSSSIEVWLFEDGEERKVVFSGDIGNFNQPIIKDPSYVKGADYVVMESTYGDRYHGERSDYKAELAKIITEAFDRNGNVVIPSFAVGRTQELLYTIREIKEENIIPKYKNFTVFLDSPLAIEATRVFKENSSGYYDEQAMELVKAGINPLQFEGLKLSVSAEESKQINFDPNPKVIISASGMCEAGRIRHHLKHNLWRKECTVLFVGFQAIGTLGRTIVEGAKIVKLFGEEIEIHARIEKLNGISGHADKGGLLKWVEEIGKPVKQVFVTHGEDSVTEYFASVLRDEKGLPAYAPYSGDVFDLKNGVMVSYGDREHKRVKSGFKKSAIYETLLEALAQLTALIKTSDGRPNKDIKRMTRDINDLYERWK